MKTRADHENRSASAGVAIPGSPFSLAFVAGPPQVASTLAGGLDATAVLQAGEKRVIWLQLRDAFGNAAEDYAIADTLQAVATLVSSTGLAPIVYRCVSTWY